MDENFRTRIRKHLREVAHNAAYIDVERASADLMRELNWQGSTAYRMLTRMIMSECVLAGFAMRLGREPELAGQAAKTG